MKKIFYLFLLISSFVQGQTITGDKLILRTQLQLAGYKITGISNDSAMAGNSIMTIPTQYAVRNYVANYVASHGSSAAGSSGQVQYNNAGSFGALDSFTVSANPDNVGIGVLSPTARLDIQGSGSTSATNALRVRNSSGTNLLIIRNDQVTDIGSSTKFVRFDDGNVRFTGIGSYFFDIKSNGNKLQIVNSTNSFDYTKGLIVTPEHNYGFNVTTPLAGLHNNINTTASTPSMLLSGTGFSGGTATTTKPTLLIEPTGTTSTGWSTSGTKLGVNAESGFSGNFLDIQINGVSKLYVNSGGGITPTYFSAPSNSFYDWQGRSQMQSPANGIIKFSNGANNDFSRLQFGGTTSSFPALKRSTTTLEARLADDSGYAAVQTLYDRFGSGSPESVVTAPVGAIYHRTDGGAGTSFYVKESGTGSTGWVAK